MGIYRDISEQKSGKPVPSKTINQIISNMEYLRNELQNIERPVDPTREIGYVDLEGRIKKGGGNTIVVPPVNVQTDNAEYSIPSETVLTTANLDAGGAFQFGSDYYIYISEPWYAYITPETEAPVLTLSLNQSAPAELNNPIIIGGFHYGKIRNSFTITDVSDGILTNSVWDLNHMPSCYKLGIDDPAYQIGGMVEVVPNALWADIYLASNVSDTSGRARCASLINQQPLTLLTLFDFVSRGRAGGKRLLNYAEWTVAALGSPQGLDESNLHGWTKTSNTAIVKTAATAAADADADYILGYNTSLLGLRDCVGNVYEWLADLSNRQDTTEWAWQDVLDAGELSLSGDFGQAYLPNLLGLAAYLAGGYWLSGVHAGARTVSVYDCPWRSYSAVGCRFGCESYKKEVL